MSIFETEREGRTAVLMELVGKGHSPSAGPLPVCHCGNYNTDPLTLDRMIRLCCENFPNFADRRGPSSLFLLKESIAHPKLTKIMKKIFQK